MAVTLVLGAICAATILFMLRFLVAILGEDGKAARVGYAVQIGSGSDGGERSGKHEDEGIPEAPPIPVPLEERLLLYADIPVWQQSPISANDLGGSSSEPRQQH